MKYQINIEPSQHSFPCDAQETILDAALRAGIELNYGCRNGLCGSCRGKIIQGTFCYADSKLPGGISQQEHEIGMALFCKAKPTSDLVIEVKEISSGTPLEIKTLPCKVVKIERLNHDVVAIFLKSPDSQRLQFRAGQYLNILMPSGKKRAFSIASAPHHDQTIELQVRYVKGGDFTEYAFHHMKLKDLIRIEGPMGSFYLRENTNRPLLFLCGGTGFAPTKGIIEHAFHILDQRPIYLYRGALAFEDLYQNELPQAWMSNHPNLTYVPVLSSPKIEDHWTGRTGFVHAAVLDDFADLSGMDVYLCGPPQMIRAAVDSFCARGLPKDRIFSDAFEYAVDK